MTEPIYNLFLFRLLPKLILLFGISPAKFITYHLYYMEKLRIIESIYDLDIFHKSNYLAIFLSASDSSDCTDQSGLTA